MREPADFDARLSEVLDRYAARAPMAPDIREVAEAAMGPADRPVRRWSVPIRGSLQPILLLGLVLLAMLAVAFGAGGGLIRRDPLAVAVPTPVATPSPSPAPGGEVIADGEAWIAYMASFRSNLIEVIRPDGTGRHRLFPLVPGGEQQHPDWSPDGQRLVFSVIGTDTQVIWVGDADGGNTSLLVDCQVPCRWADEPAWSPDGGSVAYQRMTSTDGVDVSTLEILDLATRQTRILFTGPAGKQISAPRWSGDGTRIVFESVTSPAAGAEVTAEALAIIDVTGASAVPREITKPEDRCNNPDWSWVNDRIVCSKPVLATGVEGPSDLYTLRPDGTGFAALTDLAAAGGSAIKPTWLPDGSAVIFNSEGVMRTVHADGTGLALAVSGNAVQGLHPRLRPTP
jgi:Tol biopolymer transport system component